MKVLAKVLKNILFVFTIFLTSLCLFTFILSIDLNSTLMSSQYHQKLLSKNNVYSYVDDLITTYISDAFGNLKTQSSEPSSQHKEIYKILENSTSSEMIKMNIDSVTEQIFQYFRGERKYLPDLYIDLDTPLTNEKSVQNTATDSIDTSQVSGQIRKINLHAILLTLNRTDILDQLTLVKFIYFVISHLTTLSILSAALMLLLIFLVFRKSKIVIRWLTLALFFCGIFNLALAIVLFVYLNKILPDNIYLFTMSIPLKSELILSYINDLLFPVSFFCFILGILFPLLSIVIHSFYAKFAKIVKVIKALASRLPAKSKNILKYGVMTVVTVSIVSGMGYNLYAFKSGYDSNSFSNVVSKLTNKNTVIQVISAKNDTLYTLQVKLVDTSTGQPIPDIQINAIGKSKVPEKHFNIAGITDKDGSTKFTLGQGTFHLSFSSLTPLDEYNLPSPFFYELKTAGTTILTVNMDKKAKEEPSNGIGEVEVLDEDNMPVKNVELYLEEKINIETDQDSEPNDNSLVSSDSKAVKYYSVTNENGIAVFKLPQGTYKTGFSESKFPASYVLPQVFEMSISSDYVTRYTIRVPQKNKELTN
ncbi:prealbumin-like fold domain-containing protein [Acetivibrio cellulolyticus]|uniref:prealbumin-like fold domain-containing protein n=1 Tax=Acetivibrio cellulolyticus TaxID=35830 RepID=UPI0001E2CCC4|nr:prealbumin-like fold domain-containing protein [Acetivibrio cellulolyticus]